VILDIISLMVEPLVLLFAVAATVGNLLSLRKVHGISSSLSRVDYVDGMTRNWGDKLKEHSREIKESQVAIVKLQTTIDGMASKIDRYADALNDLNMELITRDNNLLSLISEVKKSIEDA